ERSTSTTRTMPTMSRLPAGSETGQLGPHGFQGGVDLGGEPGQRGWREHQGSAPGTTRHRWGMDVLTDHLVRDRTIAADHDHGVHIESLNRDGCGSSEGTAGSGGTPVTGVTPVS